MNRERPDSAQKQAPSALAECDAGVHARQPRPTPDGQTAIDSKPCATAQARRLSRYQTIERPHDASGQTEQHRQIMKPTLTTTRGYEPLPRRASKGQAGIAAVEFALTLPVLLLVVLSIIEFSLIFYNKAVITNASREAARAAIVLRSPKLSAADIRQIALDRCTSSLVSFGPSSPTVDVTPATGGGAFGTPLTVRIRYVYQGLALGPLISAITQPIELDASTTMNNE